jgi:hypothetical protein
MRTCENPSGCNNVVFRTDKLTRKGYCKFCYPRLSTDLDKRSIIQKAIAKNTDTAKVRELINMPENIEMVNQEKWFRHVAKVIEANPYCWETGEYISEADYRNATAHIFPKAHFGSVATHPLNFLILSPRNGAHDKTHRLDTFCKMKVWPIAVKRFLEFEPLITEKHKYLNTFKELINANQ